MRNSIGIVLLSAAGAVAFGYMVMSCRSPVATPSAVTSQAAASAEIEFTSVPPAGEGSADILQPVEGRVRGARPDEKIVLFAQSGVWWVQPSADKPFTSIRKDSTWKNSTHPGMAYAALLVDAGYQPPITSVTLPEHGGPVHAVIVANGRGFEEQQFKKLTFSGYEWLVRQTPSFVGGSRNRYDASNAWVDGKGRLHLRIEADAKGWTSAAIHLRRSLGYGSYRFVVSDVARFKPPVVLEIAAWDGSGPNRQMGIEVSRWGEPSDKNSQYVIQPYYVPANVIRFNSRAGQLTYSFDWEPGRVAFRTFRGSGAAGTSEVLAAHVFTSGVPPAGNDTIRLQLYVFDNRRVRLEHGVEVVVEQFEYLP